MINKNLKFICLIVIALFIVYGCAEKKFQVKLLSGKEDVVVTSIKGEKISEIIIPEGAEVKTNDIGNPKYSLSKDEVTALINIKPRSKVKFEDLGSKTITIKLDTGEVYINIPKPLTPAVFNVYTPNVMTSVKGTSFRVIHSQNKSSIIVEEGEVEVNGIKKPELKAIVKSGVVQVVEDDGSFNMQRSIYVGEDEIYMLRDNLLEYKEYKIVDFNQIGITLIATPANAIFEKGSSELSESGKTILNYLTSALRDYKNIAILISTWALKDEIPQKITFEEFALKRAENIAYYFRLMNVDGDRLKFGIKNPGLFNLDDSSQAIFEFTIGLQKTKLQLPGPRRIYNY